jgi:predicted Holliday junction resolvase-like endonuclease
MESIYVVFIAAFFILLIVTLVAVVIYLFLQLRQAQAQAQGKNENLIKDYEGKIREINLKHQSEVEKARQQSVATSRHTIKGQIAEQMAPLLKGFPYIPSDSRFIGDPIDYVVFKGYTDIRDGRKSNDDFEIVIVDIKHNTASLSPGQRAIAKAVESGRVRFEVIRVLEDGTIKVYPYGKNRETSTSGF